MSCHRGTRAIAAATALLTLVVPGCGGGGGNGGTGPDKYVTVQPDSLLMIVGQKEGLTATFHNQDGSTIAGAVFKWRSDDSTIAAVDSVSGEVTAKGLGSTDVHATETGGTDGTARVTVGMPAGACNGIENVDTWTAHIDLVYTDAASQSPTAVTIATNHHAADFTLGKQPGPPNPLVPMVIWSGTPTGNTTEVNETVTDQSTVPTSVSTIHQIAANLGPAMPLFLEVSKNDCTWVIQYGPTYTAEVTTTGSTKPDTVAGLPFASLQSAPVVLETDWQQAGVGANLNSSFPVYPADQGSSHTTENFYGVGDLAAQVLFTIVSPPRGPANVTFHAMPHLAVPIRAGR
ncbi:MAG TPA: Ig-like domain-containing protein [Gemmatimonadales bacterium]|nr:Ig-like domain-containing protein [Gemmatimonadales bacterium]